MKKLKDLKPCIYESRVEAYGTLRKHWEDASAKELMWLLTHEESTIPRRILLGITLKALVVCEHVLPAASKSCLLDLQRWVDGEEVDLKAVCDAADAAAANAYSAAYVAACAVADAAAYAAANAYSAAAANYAAYAAVVADYDAASQKQAEIIREAISFEEACSYLDLDPEEVLT